MTLLTTDDFGVIFPADGTPVPLEQYAETWQAALHAKSRSAWIIGDLYLYADAAGEDYAVVLDGAGISLRTAQNYASTCSAFPRPARTIRLSQSHYTAVASLARVDLAAALTLLRTAKQRDLDRDELRALAAEQAGGNSPSATLLLVYDKARGVFVPSFTPEWLANGYSREVTVRAGVPQRT